MKKIYYLALVALLATSCWDWKNLPPVDLPPPTKVPGYVPVYSVDPTIYSIYADTPREVKSAGKIYVKNNLIFQNDLGYGIHIIDKTNPSYPKRIGFINLRGNLEISIKGDHLYANSYKDLVVVDISDWRQPKEIQRIKNAFHQGGEAYAAVYSSYTFIPLPENRVYYECVDMTKGEVTGWKKDSVYNNVCYYY